MRKRILSILLCIVMCLTLVPVGVSAAGSTSDLQIQYHQEDRMITWNPFPNAVRYSVGIRNLGSNVNLLTVETYGEQIDMEEILSEYLSVYGMITHTAAPGANAGFYVNSLTNDYGIKGSYDVCIRVTYQTKDAFGNTAQKTEDTTVTRVAVDYVLKNGYPGEIGGIRIVRRDNDRPMLTWEDNRREGGVKRNCRYRVTVSFVNEGNTYCFDGSGVSGKECTLYPDRNEIDLTKLENELIARGIRDSALTVKAEAELTDIYSYKYTTSASADVFFVSNPADPYAVVCWSDDAASRFTAACDLDGMDHSPDFSRYTYQISLMRTVSATNRTAVYSVNAASGETKKTFDFSGKVAGNGSGLYSVLVQEIYKSGSHAGEEHAAFETWKRSFDVSSAKPLAVPSPTMDPNGKVRWEAVPHTTGYHVVLKDRDLNVLTEFDTGEAKCDLSSYMTESGVYRCCVTAFDATGEYARSAEGRTEWTAYTVHKFLGIYVYGVPVTEANRYDVLGDGSVKFLPDGKQYYDYLSSETLVLDHVNFNKSRYYRDGLGNKAVIYIDNDIAVYLIGDNVIDVDWEEDLDGIYLAPLDVLNFYSDSGSLTVNVSRNGGRAIAAPGSCVTLWENTKLDLTGHHGFYSDAGGDIGTLDLCDNSELRAYGLRADDDKEGYAIESPWVELADNAHLYAEYEWNQPCMSTWSDGYYMFRSTVLTFRGIVDLPGMINRTWTDVEEINGKNVWNYRAVEIRAGVTDGHLVSGTVTSYGSSVDAVTLKLTKAGQSTPSFTVSVTGCNANYSFAGAASGTYTLTVSKPGHASREYTVVVGSSDLVQNVTINLLGDVNGDGSVDSKDVLLLKRRAADLVKLTAEQETASDVNHDENIDSKDVLMLKRAAAGLVTLK